MATVPEARAELKALRAKVALASRAARAANDQAKVAQLGQLLGKIDDELDDLAIEGLAAAAARLGPFRQRLEELTRIALSWPFGSGDAPQDHERPFRAKDLPPNDFADAGPVAPPPPAADPLPPTTVPQVSAEWSENYWQLWNTLVIRPDWHDRAAAIAQRIMANQSHYAAAVAGTSVPWWFVAVIHCMECSMRFDQHLHNGDPLSGRTVQVPPGRPAAGSPPFTWEQSARDAIQFQRLDRVTDWSLPNVLFNWHRYNGINNEYKRRGIPTPYLWSGSTHYKKGKYVNDGLFDSEAVSQQVGAAVILRTLVDVGAVAIDRPRRSESAVRALLQAGLEEVAGDARLTDAAVEVLFALLVERRRRDEELDPRQVKDSLSKLIDYTAASNGRTVNAFEVVKIIGANWCGFPPFCDRIPEPPRIQ
jgi:lysozyme family protein